MRFQDGRGEYNLPAWIEFSAAWTSPGGLFRIYGEQFLYEFHYRRQGAYPEDRLGMNAWELEFRPHPYLGLKVERPRIGSMSSLGFLLNPPFRPFGFAFFLEANFGHDRYTPPHSEVFLLGKSMEYIFGESLDEGRGANYAFAPGAGL